jgi:hypothetical protein
MRNWQDTVDDFGNSVMGLFYLIGAIVLIATFFKGMGWLVNTLMPIVAAISVLALALFPILLLIAIWRPARGPAGLIGVAISYVLGFYVWIKSITIAFVLGGPVWTILGVLFAGVGVIAMAALVALLHAQWVILIETIIAVIVVLVTYFLSLILISKADMPQRVFPPPPPDDWPLKT